jgi:phospho-N-acetylmuramoyl-pentapeptide-transferase
MMAHPLYDLGPFAIAFMLAAVLGAPLIGFLKRLAYRQHAYEDAPQTHQKKTGTPTMGGMLFAVAPIVTLAFCAETVLPAAWPFAFLMLGAGVIGFVDDYSAIRRGRNRGLGAKAKFLATGLLGAVFLFALLHVQPDGIDVLFLGHIPVWAWFVLSLAAILATMHAVNLTDGLDGLASGTILPPLAVFVLLGTFGPAQMIVPHVVGMYAAAAMMGAVCGFLIYNRHPAKMFMGDTGSLALGAGLAGVAILTGGQLLLLLVGGVFVAETLSVMIQVTSYKLTKRRVFRMSPLHHHFELGGWPETKVTASFWAASLVLSLIGFFILVHA